MNTAANAAALPSVPEFAAYSVIAEGLTKQFGNFVAVDHIDFQVEKGTIFGFLGPNGSGKTTTIRMLLGLLRPTSGRGWVLGHDIYETDQLKRKVGYMSQKFTLYQDLTVSENLDFYGHLYGVKGERLAARKQTIVEMAGLQGREHEITHNLAGGWKQRLALGAAIIHEPQLLFLDEPTAGVDPVSRRDFWDLLYLLADGGTTIFVTTHYMDEAEHCHKVAFILNSKLVAQGTPAEIKHNEMRGEVLEIECDRPDNALERLQEMHGFEEVGLYGAQIHVVAEGIAERRLAIARDLQAAGIETQKMDIVEPSLEDVFISTVKHNRARKASDPTSEG